MRLSQNGKPGTAILGKTLDYIPVPEANTENMAVVKNTTKNVLVSPIKLQSSTANILDIMREQSASRKKVNEKL
jgi:hypothetical protein